MIVHHPCLYIPLHLCLHLIVNMLKPPCLNLLQHSYVKMLQHPCFKFQPFATSVCQHYQCYSIRVSTYCNIRSQHVKTSVFQRVSSIRMSTYYSIRVSTCFSIRISYICYSIRIATRGSMCCNIRMSTC